MCPFVTGLTGREWWLKFLADKNGYDCWNEIALYRGAIQKWVCLHMMDRRLEASKIKIITAKMSRPDLAPEPLVFKMRLLNGVLWREAVTAGSRIITQNFSTVAAERVSISLVPSVGRVYFTRTNGVLVQTDKSCLLTSEMEAGRLQARAKKHKPYLEATLQEVAVMLRTMS